MRKKILILTPFYPPNIGGAETFAEDLVRISKKDYDVHLGIITWDYKWHGLPFFRALFIIPVLFFEGFLLCWKNKIDTICAIGLMAGTAGMFLKLIFKVKLLVIPLSLYDFKHRPFFSLVAGWVLKYVDMVFCESDISRKDLFYTGIKWQNTEIFTHWVDQTRFFPIEHNNAHLKVLFVGRPIPEKGKHIIQEVEKELWEVDFEYVEDVQYEDLPEYYQMADVLVVPSLYAESPNRVVIEGACCGCVVIVSDKGALPEQVGGWGFVVEPAVVSFQSSINALNMDRSFTKVWRNVTIKHAQKYFTEKNAQTIMREY